MKTSQHIAELHLLAPKILDSLSSNYNGSQHPQEFEDAWGVIINRLIKRKAKTTLKFLEIGAFEGIWPLMLSIVCKDLGIPLEYTTITMLDHNPANKPLLNVKKYYESHKLPFTLIDKDSQLKENLLSLDPSYDFVFIDADHRYDGAKKDIELYASLASDTLFFHDIRPKEPSPHCGVYAAIRDSGIQLSQEIVHARSQMGIGFVFKK